MLSRYIETHHLGGKKRKKMIFFVVLIVIFLIFVVFFQFLFTFTNLNAQFYPTTTFYYICLPAMSENKSEQIQKLTSRGAGGVEIENEIALALFSSHEEAQKVQQNLVESTSIKKMSTPKLATSTLSPEKLNIAKKMYDYFVSTITMLCSKTIELDGKKITEHDFRVALDIHLTNLTSFFESNYPNSPSTLTPFCNLLTLSISELKYLLTTTTYTENLTPYISVVRLVTLNLLFSSTKQNSVK